MNREEMKEAIRELLREVLAEAEAQVTQSDPTPLEKCLANPRCGDVVVSENGLYIRDATAWYYTTFPGGLIIPDSLPCGTYIGNIFDGLVSIDKVRWALSAGDDFGDSILHGITNIAPSGITKTRRRLREIGVIGH